jgi:hypothetical protein
MEGNETVPALGPSQLAFEDLWEKMKDELEIPG